MTRLIDQLSRGTTLPWEVRDARTHVLASVEDCYQVLLDRDDDAWTVEERLALGLIVAREAGDKRLEEWFVDLLGDLNLSVPEDTELLWSGYPRLAPYRDLLISMIHTPAAVDAQAVGRLGGPSADRRLVIAAQIVGFLSYLSRLLDGLAVLSGEMGRD